MSDSKTKDDSGETAAAVAAPTPVHEDDKEAARLCNQWVESGISSNKSIQFLLKTLMDSGCTPPDKFIRCMKCEQPTAGGFGMVMEESVVDVTNNNTGSSSTAAAANSINRKEQCHRTMQDLQEQINREKAGSSRLKIKPEIFVCQQYMENEKMTHQTVHHELIHAIDLCRTRMDPLHNCVQMACTEIRAENLSGECSFWRELLTARMANGFKGHGQQCVRRRALLSVRANPNCTDRAEEYVDAAMARCFQDVYPYDRHPNQR